MSSVLADGTLRLVHCTGGRALEAERYQAATGRGPALIAMTTAGTVTVANLARAWEYPGVRVRAVLGQLGSMTAVPIGSHGRVNAVIDLWWSRRDGPTQPAAAAAEHLQHVAEPVLELIEEQDRAYRDPSCGARLIGWDVPWSRSRTRAEVLCPTARS